MKRRDSSILVPSRLNSQFFFADRRIGPHGIGSPLHHRSGNPRARLPKDSSTIFLTGSWWYSIYARPFPASPGVTLLRSCRLLSLCLNSSVFYCDFPVCRFSLCRHIPLSCLYRILVLAPIDLSRLPATPICVPEFHPSIHRSEE